VKRSGLFVLCWSMNCVILDVVCVKWYVESSWHCVPCVEIFYE